MNTKQAKLSLEMQNAVELMRANGGKLARYAGGYWMKPGLTGAAASGSSAMRGSIYFSTATVKGLVKRGLAIETAWRKNALGQFATEITLKS